MRIKKYVAKSMTEALLQIKEDLGENALILKHSKVSKMFGPEEIEVTAAIDEEAGAQKAPAFQPLHVSGGNAGDLGAPVSGLYGRPRPTSSSGAETVKPEAAMPEPAAPNVRPYFPPRLSSPYGGQGQSEFSDTGRYQRQGLPSKAGVPGRQDADEISELKADVKELKELVKSILAENTAQPRAGVPQPSSNTAYTDIASAGDNEWNAFVRRLTDSEVKPNIAKKLVDSIRVGSQADESEFEKKLSETMSDQFPVSGPLKLKKGGPLKVAFVGPTGSGKTTTLAKLVAECCVNYRKKVSIITADTYRIAAIEQIRMFADTVKVGLQVVFSSDEIPAALDACVGSDVIFVDTAGRSQRNREHMEELRILMDVLRPDETHLVLSATTKDSDLIDMVHNYRNIRVNRLLFTKLDETARLGNVFNVVSELGIPVSYFTVGQSVPDDIELAQSCRFVKRLMEGRAL